MSELEELEIKYNRLLRRQDRIISKEIKLQEQINNLKYSQVPNFVGKCFKSIEGDEYISIQGQEIDKDCDVLIIKGKTITLANSSGFIKVINKNKLRVDLGLFPGDYWIEINESEFREVLSECVQKLLESCQN